MKRFRKMAFHFGSFPIGMLFIFNVIQAQNWPRIYGDNIHSLINDISEYYDKGFCITAFTYNNQGVNKYGWIIKTDINGNILWDKKFGGGNDRNWFGDSFLTADQGLIIAGVTTKYSSGDFDPNFIKLNVCGEMEWCKVMVSPEDNYSKGIIQLEDGTYIGMLQYYGEGETYARISLVKMDQSGEPIWIQRLAQEDTLIYNEEGGDLYLTSDSNFLVSGECFHPGLEAFWIKTDTSGNQIWDLMWQGGIGAAYQVAENSNGFFYCAGGFAGPGYPITPSIFKFDLDGNPHYMSYLLGDTIKGGGADPIIFLNDSILISGMNWRVSSNVDEGFSEVMKTDTLGNIIDRRILLNENKPPKTIIISEEGKILIGGNYVVDGNFDIYLWKMNSNLEDDTLYTQPITYDSLCPYEIQSDTVDLNCGVFVNIDELPTKEEYESMIKISPNPARDWVVLTLPDLLAEGTVELVVYDVFGREAWRHGGMEAGKRGSGVVLPVNRMISLDVSGFSPGLYIAVVVDRMGRRYTGKFVVVR